MQTQASPQQLDQPSSKYCSILCCYDRSILCCYDLSVLCCYDHSVIRLELTVHTTFNELCCVALYGSVCGGDGRVVRSLNSCSNSPGFETTFRPVTKCEKRISPLSVILAKRQKESRGVVSSPGLMNCF